MNKKDVKPIWFFIVALLIFSLLGLEFLVFGLTNWVDGQAPLVLDWPQNWYAVVFHWTVTIAIWFTGALICYRWALNKGVLSNLVRFDFKRRDGIIMVFGVVFVVFYSLIHSQLTGLVFPQVWREYNGFRHIYGGKAWVVSVFQNLYYLVEYVLVIILVALFQRAGELWFKRSMIPWGSLGLLLTWGMIHLFTRPAGAVSVMVWSLIPGIFFVLTKKNFYAVLIIALLGFIL